MGANAYLRAKIEERAAKSAMLQSIQDRAAAANRDLDDQETKTFDEIVARLHDLDRDITRIKEFDEGAAKFVSIVGAQNLAQDRAETAYAGAKAGKEAELVETRATEIDFGKRFIESTAFKAYRGHGSSDRVTLPGPATREFRAAISLGTLVNADGDSIIPPMQWAGPAGPQFPNTFLGVIGRVATNQNAVVYLRWEPIPPGDAAVVVEGDLKPEASMNPVEDTALLYTIAHFKAITRQALEDYPQILAIVQDRLLAGVRSKLEHDAVAALTTNVDIDAVEGEDLQSAIRLGIATAESNGYSPNAILVNPFDAADLDFSRVAGTLSGPVRGSNTWNLPIIPAMSVPQGSSYVGDFKMGETWFDRGTLDVFMTDSHADFFLRNQLVILAEARGAFKITEPGAIYKVSATVTP